MTGSPEDFQRSMQLVEAGAKEAGRKIGPDFYTSCLTTACVLRPGEKLTDERVINETGSQVACTLHFAYEIWKQRGEKDELIPPFFANIWDDYVKRVKNFSLPENARFRQIHDGHCTFLQPEERRFITPEAIAGVCIVGTPEEIIDRCARWRRPESRRSRCCRRPTTSARFFATSRRWSCRRFASRHSAGRRGVVAHWRAIRSRSVCACATAL